MAAVITAIARSRCAQKRDRVGRLCLRYVNWRESRRPGIWIGMALKVTQPHRPLTVEGLEIRALGSTDALPVLTAIHNRAYVGASDYQRAGWVQRHALAVAKGFDPDLAWLAYIGTEVVGYCMARQTRGGSRFVGRITGLAVLPQYRRRKIGTALMQHAITELARRGAEEVHLQVPRPDHFSQALYRKLGFEENA